MHDFETLEPFLSILNVDDQTCNLSKCQGPIVYLIQ